MENKLATLHNSKILAFGFSVAIILIVMIRVVIQHNSIYMSCKADIVTRKILTSGDYIDLKIIGDLFIYDEDNAIIIQRGQITTKDKKYYIDQKLILKIRKIDTGIYIMTYREVVKNSDDDTPESITNKFPLISLGIKNNLFSLRKVRQDAYIMYGALSPIMLCRPSM